MGFGFLNQTQNSCEHIELNGFRFRFLNRTQNPFNLYPMTPPSLTLENDLMRRWRRQEQIIDLRAVATAKRQIPHDLAQISHLALSSSLPSLFFSFQCIKVQFLSKRSIFFVISMNTSSDLLLCLIINFLDNESDFQKYLTWFYAKPIFKHGFWIAHVSETITFRPKRSGFNQNLKPWQRGWVTSTEFVGASRGPSACTKEQQEAHRGHGHITRPREVTWARRRDVVTTRSRKGDFVVTVARKRLGFQIKTKKMEFLCSQ